MQYTTKKHPKNYFSYKTFPLSQRADPLIVKQFREDLELLLGRLNYNQTTIAGAMGTHKGNISNYRSGGSNPGKLVIARFYNTFKFELKKLRPSPLPNEIFSAIEELVIEELGKPKGGKKRDTTQIMLSAILERMNLQDQAIKSLTDKLEKIENKLPPDGSTLPEK